MRFIRMSYADDIALISPTVMGIQRMLDACVQSVDSQGLRFNIKKRASITFVRSRRISPCEKSFTLDNDILVCNS